MINRFVSIHKVLELVLDIGRLPLLILSLCNVRGTIVLVIQLSDLMLEQGGHRTYLVDGGTIGVGTRVS